MNISSPSATDGELVTATLAGSREAFTTLVERHQQLVCALAYAKTGSRAASEDIAQETFVAAWKNLAGIRSPENIRGWLCGTARHLASRFHRGQRRTDALSDEMAAAGPGPSEEAMTREEEAMLWATLERLPENFREPLVLFHRGGQSVQEIAAALEISEDAAKQRLSRGRAMLREAVRSRVETALARSRPGLAFTTAVLAAVPALASTAQAATGIAAAKGAGTIAGSGLLSMLGGAVIGLAGAWVGMKCALTRAESDRERRFIVGVAAWSAATIVFFMGALAALVYWSGPMLASRPGLWIALMAADVLLFTASLFGFSILNGRVQMRIRAEERSKRGVDAGAPALSLFDFEYRSRLEFLGLPLIHMRLGGFPGAVAKGWIAYGPIAIGPVLAIGGIAVGGIALGGVSVGVLASGGIGLGLFSFSGLALGGVVLGGLAIGWIAMGGAAWGWLAAFGGQAWAGLYGLGRHVSAPHANDAAAKAFFHDHGLMQAAGWIADHGWWAQAAIFGPILLMLLWVSRLRRPAMKMGIFCYCRFFGLSCTPKKEEQKSMDFAVKTVPETLFFCVEESVTQAEIPDFAMRAIEPLFEALGKAGQHPTGDLQFLCPQWNGPDGKSKLVIGIPVAGEFPAAPPYYLWRAPAYRCLWTEYVGPMSGIKDAWAELGTAFGKSDHRCAGSWREVYVHWVAPESAENRTELQSGIE